jgi:hypothetical protein
MVKFWLALALAVVFLLPAPARAGSFFNPDPVDLGLDNIEQETQYWCWAALIQQLLYRSSAGNPPRQCELVNQANRDRNTDEVDCCLDQEQAVCAARTGNNFEIMSLINRYGGRVLGLPLPQTPEKLYEALIDGKAVIAGVRISETMNHAYLIKGIFWDEEGQAQLLINDPAKSGTTTLSFDEARPTWIMTMTSK